MQTFMPHPWFSESLRALDDKRLGNQRSEARTIYRALVGEIRCWRNHPAVKMWRGYENALLRYGLTACYVWRVERGWYDSLGRWFLGYLKATDAKKDPNPWWLGNGSFHASHRAMLHRKNPAHYSTFADAAAILPRGYYWPDNETRRLIWKASTTARRERDHDECDHVWDADAVCLLCGRPGTQPARRLTDNPEGDN